MSPWSMAVKSWAGGIPKLARVWSAPAVSLGVDCRVGPICLTGPVWFAQAGVDGEEFQMGKAVGCGPCTGVPTCQTGAHPLEGAVEAGAIAGSDGPLGIAWSVGAATEGPP